MSRLFARAFAAFALLPVCLAATACTAEGELGLGAEAQHAYVKSDWIWTRNSVPVCFENPNGATAAERALVRTRVNETWAAVSAVRFVGWDACGDDSTGIHITFSDELPYVGSWSGTHDPARHSVQMVLNTDYGGASCERCFEAVVVHEFGHAIGLAHEHNRDDRDADCTKAHQGSYGDYTYGDYDADSVMNYCNDRMYRDGGELSDGDIAAAIHMYGPRVPQPDLDGDGYADLIVGTPGENTSAGAINVLFGGGLGLTAGGDELWMQSSPGVPGGSESDDHFGRAVAAGDFDGDGYTDVAVGAFGEDIGGKVNTGAVSVFYGSDGGLVPGNLWHQNTAGVPGSNETEDRFGYAVAAADFDADGYDDLAIGVPGEDAHAGEVTILYGTANGLSAGRAWSFDQLDTNTGAAHEPDDRFGMVLATGDFDADGYPDLAIGAPGENRGSADNSGAVFVVRGSMYGISTSDGRYLDQDEAGIKGKAEAGDYFGKALAAGDYDGDGIDDLAIGVPGEDNDSGAVQVIYGSLGGLTTADDLLDQDSDGMTGAPEQGDRFGAALAAGDFDRDGVMDLAIGVPGEDLGMFDEIVDAGAVHVVFGDEDGLDSGDSEWWVQDGADINDAWHETGDRFGAALTVGDYNGDTHTDLAIGAPGEDAAAGAVIVLYGEDDGLASTGEQLWQQDTAGVAGGGENGDAFGFALR